jgi:hypothetical protein
MSVSGRTKTLCVKAPHPWGVQGTVAALTGVFLERSNEQNLGLSAATARDRYGFPQKWLHIVDGAFQGIVFMTAACSA